MLNVVQICPTVRALTFGNGRTDVNNCPTRCDYVQFIIFM